MDSLTAVRHGFCWPSHPSSSSWSRNDSRRISITLITAGLTLAVASAPFGLAGAATDPVATLTGKHSLRAPVTDETFYFVMADRFENGCHCQRHRRYLRRS